MHTQSSCPSRSSSCLRLSAFLLLSIVFVFVRIPYADAADPECACTHYLNNAVPDADAYCFTPAGTSTFCIPYTSPCQSFAGLNTNPCAKKTNSPTTPPPTASTTCACIAYLGGAAAGDPAYCAQYLGTSQFCYPNQAQCSPQNGLPTSTCFAPTSSPTQKPVAPTSPPTTQSTTCACGIYLGGAAAGQSNYCYQSLGTTIFCYPGSTQCSPQNGLPTLSCSASTPTNSPTATVPPTAGSPTCACTVYLEGATASPTSAYCTQTLGTSQFCYPDVNPCPAKNGLASSRCLPANVPTNPPVTKQPSKAPATSTPSKSPVKPVPTTARPTAKPGPTAKPVTVKPSTATPTKKPVPTAPTPPTVPTPPTLSPTQKPTSKGGLSPIAGLVIFLVIAFILFGGYQYAMEKRQEKKARVQQEQQQQQQQAPQQDLSPVSVI